MNEIERAILRIDADLELMCVVIVLLSAVRQPRRRRPARNPSKPCTKQEVMPQALPEDLGPVHECMRGTMPQPKQTPPHQRVPRQRNNFLFGTAGYAAHGPRPTTEAERQAFKLSFHCALCHAVFCTQQALDGHNCIRKIAASVEDDSDAA